MTTMNNELIDKLLSDKKVFAAMKSVKKGTVTIQYSEDGEVNAVQVVTSL